MKTLKKAGALIIQDNKLLLVKPKDSDFLINPGGKYRKNESSEECLRRELKEELDVELLDHKHYKTYKIRSDNRLLILELYLVGFSGVIGASSEVEEIFWIKKEDFEKKTKFSFPSGFHQIMADLAKDNLI